MDNKDFSRYTDEELREMLKQFVYLLTEEQCGEVLEELKA